MRIGRHGMASLGGYPPAEIKGALSRRCTACGARVGMPCVKKKRPWDLTTKPHAERRQTT